MQVGETEVSLSFVVIEQIATMSICCDQKVLEIDQKAYKNKRCTTTALVENCFANFLLYLWNDFSA